MTFRPTSPPLRFTVDGVVLVWPETPGVTIAEAAADGNWLALIPERLDEPSREHLWGRVADPEDRFELLDLHRTAMAVLGEVCGVPWHVACRLLTSAHAEWLLFDGWCVSHGLDVESVPVWRLVSAAHQWLRDACGNAEDGDKVWGRVQAQLWEEPKPIARARSASMHAGGDGWVSAEEEAETEAALAAWGI